MRRSAAASRPRIPSVRYVRAKNSTGSWYSTSAVPPGHLGEVRSELRLSVAPRGHIWMRPGNIPPRTQALARDVRQYAAQYRPPGSRFVRGRRIGRGTGGAVAHRAGQGSQPLCGLCVHLFHDARHGVECPPCVFVRHVGQATVRPLVAGGDEFLDPSAVFAPQLAAEPLVPLHVDQNAALRRV